MEFAQLTRREAAIHESGHAAVACAVGLRFHHVHVCPNEKMRWVGQCLLKTVREEPDVKLAAFQIGGPVIQLKILPQSIGQFLPLFQVSLFEHSQAFQDGCDALYWLGWASDLMNPNLIHVSNSLIQSPEALRSQMPFGWLFQLETIVREFFNDASSCRFASRLADLLEGTNQLNEDAVLALFRDSVTQQASQPLRYFIEQND